jgi:uncharacterized protein involved in exopolysaccharide biosynthesis
LIIIFWSKQSLTCTAMYFFRYASEVELLQTKTTFEDMITVLHSEHVAAIGVITNKLSETEEILKTKLENLFQVENEKESVMVDLSFTEQELKEEKLMRAQDDVAAKLLLESLIEEKRCELGALRDEGQERMQLLIDHHEVNLAAEIGIVTACFCECVCIYINIYIYMCVCVCV